MEEEPEPTLLIISICTVFSSIVSVISLFMTLGIYFRCIKNNVAIGDAYLKDLLIFKHRNPLFKVKRRKLQDTGAHVCAL